MDHLIITNMIIKVDTDLFKMILIAI